MPEGSYLYCDVSLPVPLDQPFTYSLPETLRHRVKPGSRLLVPFGPRKLTGVILRCHDERLRVESAAEYPGRLAGVTTYQSGAPNSIVVSSDVARIGASSSRATFIADPNLPAGERTLTRWFNTAAALPPEQMVQGVFGTGGRNVLIGPGFNQWDLSAIKNFDIREHTRLQFRAESFNVVNHPSFTGIDTTARFDAAGKPTGTYGAVTGGGPARVLEFGLRLTY